MQSLEGMRVAIVEDDPIMGESLVQRLELEGALPVWWCSGRDALDALAIDQFDILVCDIRLPDMNGETLFREAAPFLGAAPVIFITAFGDIDQAVRLVRAGAGDYLTKPFPIDDFLARLEHLLAGRIDATKVVSGSLGQSPAIREVETLLRRVADIDSTVLLTGESGVGKEVASRFLHENSMRSNAPFMGVNCAAIPANLLESELFGYEKGAFTDAKARHEGYAERARGGILFLDEISELSIDLQAKLLRLVQERTFHRIGGKELLPFDARIICATNVDLEERLHDGRFREDLYYRVNVIHVAVPPLRERIEDIRPLLRSYVDFFATSFESDVRGLTTLAEEIALSHNWPGNIRELRNRVERAVALATGSWITPLDMFPERTGIQNNGPESPSLATLSMVRDAAERGHILQALKQTDGHVTKAADLLGISRTTLWEKMRKHDMPADITSP